MIRWLTLFWWASTGYRGQLLRAALGVYLGVALTCVVYSFGVATREAVTTHLLGAGVQLRVKPSSVSLGPIDLTGTLFEARRIDAETVRHLASLPGVGAAWPEAWSRFPVGLQGNLLGQGIYADGAMLGLPKAAVQGDVSSPWAWKPGETVPVLAPRSLLVAYNGSFAPANHFPRLTDSAVKGLKFQIVAGRGAFAKASREAVVLRSEVVGLTGYGGALAAIVPIEVLAWVNGQLGLEDPDAFSAVLLTVAPGADPAEVEAAVRAEGWQVEDVGGVARQLADALRALNLGVAFGGAVLILVALLLMKQVYGILLRQRVGDLQTLWTLGVPRGRIMAGLSLEIGLTTVAVAGLGVATGAALVAWTAPGIGKLLAGVSGLAIDLPAGLPGGLVVAILAGAPLTAVLTAAPLILRSCSRAAVDPAGTG